MLKFNQYSACFLTWVALSASTSAHAGPSDVDIEAGPLNSALLQLGEQTKISIVFAKDIVANIQTEPLKGSYTPKAAINALLQGHCLKYEFIHATLVALKPGGCPPPPPPAPERVVDTTPIVPPGRPVMEEIVVVDRYITGSRLPQAGVRAPVPVDIITRPEIEASGHQSVGQILRYIPAVAGNSTSTLVTNGGSGTANVTLRGLSAANTLVLLNGRRLNAEAMKGSSVDLNTLPIALVERIEILKDGASAVYGSDAVAGVVNVLTRKDLNGWNADIYIGQSGRGDLDTKNLSLSFGFSNERSRWLLGASYYDQGALFSRDRDLSESSDDRARGGIDKRSSSTSPSRIRLPTGPVILADNTLAGDDPTHYRDATSEDRFEYRDFTSLIVPSERTSIFWEGEWRFEHFNAFAEILATRTESTNILAPTPLFTGFENLVLTVDENQAFNPFGIPLTDVRRRLTELSERRQRNETSTHRGVFGLTGDWQRGTWTVAFQQSRTRARETFAGSANAFRIQRALTDDCPPPCVPLNLFGPPGSVSPESVAWISTRTRSTGVSRLRALSATTDFAIGSLPAGEFEISAGAEYRREWLDTEPDPLLISGSIIGAANEAPTNGERSSLEAFTEIRVPLVREQPLFHRLDAYLAGRYSDYDDFGQVWNPRMMLYYQPTPAWSLRASVTYGFRAPNLIELAGGQSQSFSQLNDLCSSAAQAAILPGCNGQQSDSTLNQFLTQKGGNPDLKPERARTVSFGVGFERQYGRTGMRVALDYYKIRQRNVVDTNAQLIVDENARGNGFPGRVLRDANGNITRVLATFLNLKERDVRGLDFTWRLTFATENAGEFELALNATRIDRFADRAAPGQPEIDYAGTFSDEASNGDGALPDWKASFGIHWNRQRWRGQYNVYVVSELEEQVPLLNTTRDIELWATHNVQLSYLGPATNWFRISAGINNVLDEAPPFSAAAFNDSYDSRTYDITGRYAYIRIDRSI